DTFRSVAVEDRAPLAVDVVDAVLVSVRRGGTSEHLAGDYGGRRQARGLHQTVRDVDPEPVHATVQPEPQDVSEFGACLGMVPVEPPSSPPPSRARVRTSWWG